MTQMGHREFSIFDYALINPMQVSAEQWRDLPSQPLCPDGFKADIALMPHLIRLKDLDVEERNQLLMRSDDWLQQSRSPFFGALLYSCQPVSTLAGHLSELMIMMAPDRQKFWFRFHDSRVLDRLDWLLDDTQLQRVMGPISSWAWFDVFARCWRVCQRPKLDGKWHPMRWSTDQWAALRRVDLLNLCSKRLEREGLMYWSSEQGMQRLDRHLQQAQVIGLKDRDDLCEYAIRLEVDGPTWLDRPEVRGAIQKALQGEQTLVRSLAGLSQA